MSRSWLTSLNLNGNQLQNFAVQPLGTAPGSPVLGQTYYDSATTNYLLTWNGSAWVSALARANHTGTQLASTISNFASTAQSYSLNLFAAPTANLPMGGFTLSGLNTAPSASGQAAEYSWVLSRSLSSFSGALTGNLAMAGFKLTGLGTPSGAGDSAEYSWVLGRSLSSFTGAVTGNLAMSGFTLTGLNVAPNAAGQAAEYSWVIGQIQSAAAGIASKPPAVCIATANITLSGLQAIDGYTTLAGDRVLVVGQTTASTNGIYNASAGAWTRTVVDGSAPGEIEPGAMWLVTTGTVNAGSQWRVATTGAITVGTTALSIVQFGAASVYTAGNGILLTGGSFSAVANPAAGSGIVVTSGGIAVDATVVTRKYSTNIGDGSTTAIVITHSLGTQDVHLQVKRATTPFDVVECDMAATSTTTATLTFAVAPTAAQYRVTVLG